MKFINNSFGEIALTLTKTLDQELVMVLGLGKDGSISFGHTPDMEFLKLLGLLKIVEHGIGGDLWFNPRKTND